MNPPPQGDTTQLLISWSNSDRKALANRSDVACRHVPWHSNRCDGFRLWNRKCPGAFRKSVKYLADYKLLLSFEDGSLRQVDLESHLDGEVFEPLKDITNFKSAHVNTEVATVVWNNEADMSPDFLYGIGMPGSDSALAG
jgi:hypothetical protein